MIKIKRVYVTPVAEDGYRILVDRLWPRGMSKAKANLDLWLKDIAPTEDLRQWFSQNSDRYKEFQTKYQSELAEKKYLTAQVKQLEKAHPEITLIYAAKDTKHNNAIVLQTELQKK